MNRRVFIAVIGAGFVGAILMLVAGPRRVYRRLRRSYARLTAPSLERKAELLAAELPHLRFAEGACLSFVKDFIEDEKADTTFAFAPAVLKRFLLSTDYVQYRGAMDRDINYLVYYSPWRAPCYNPYRFIV